MTSSIVRIAACVAGNRCRRKTLLGLLVLVVGIGNLCGCRGWQREWMDKVVPAEDDQLAREMITILQSGDLELFAEGIERSVLGDDPEKVVQTLYDYLDHDECKSVELVGCNVVGRSGHRRSDLTYQLEYPNSWYTASIYIQTLDGDQHVMGFHLNRIAASLDELTGFTLRNKGPAHYMMLILTACVPLFIILTIVLCARTKVRLKALWIIFILFGLGKLSFNWATGELIKGTMLMLHIQLLGSGFSKAGTYAPWVLTTSLPLGAILFLLLRGRLDLTRKRATQNVPPPPAAAESNPVSGRAAAPPLPRDAAPSQTAGSEAPAPPPIPTPEP
ncbi:MAG: hypothetical protein ACYS8X_11900 [Planctomycetota bacterium]